MSKRLLSLAVIFFIALLAFSACKSKKSKIEETASSTTSQIIHHVFFWLKNPGNEADRNQLVEGLQTLRKIEVIKGLTIGTVASTEKRDVVDNTFDVSELMYFNSVEDQKIYQDHPIHAEFVRNYGHLWEKVIVYDMQTLPH